MIRTRAVLILVVAIALILSCGRSLEAPAVEVTSRDSLVGAGKIIQIKNQANEPLTEVEVTVRGAKGEVVYSEASLGPYESFELGWKKLGGWEIPDNAEIEVRAAGYLIPLKARLADTAQNEE